MDIFYQANYDKKKHDSLGFNGSHCWLLFDFSIVIFIAWLRKGNHSLGKFRHVCNDCKGSMHSYLFRCEAIKKNQAKICNFIYTNMQITR